MCIVYVCLLDTGTYTCTCTLCVACRYVHMYVFISVYFQAGASSKKNNDTKTHWRWHILRDKRLAPQLEKRAINAETSNLHHNLQPMRTNKTKEWRYYIKTNLNCKKVEYLIEQWAWHPLVHMNFSCVQYKEIFSPNLVSLAQVVSEISAFILTDTTLYT